MNIGFWCKTLYNSFLQIEKKSSKRRLACGIDTPFRSRPHQHTHTSTHTRNDTIKTTTGIITWLFFSRFQWREKGNNFTEKDRGGCGGGIVCVACSFRPSGRCAGGGWVARCVWSERGRCDTGSGAQRRTRNGSGAAASNGTRTFGCSRDTLNPCRPPIPLYLISQTERERERGGGRETEKQKEREREKETERK